MLRPPPPADASGIGGRKGRLGEHAGGVQELLRAWLAKFLIIGGGTLLWTSWTTMPGVLRSLLFCECTASCRCGEPCSCAPVVVGSELCARAPSEYARALDA